VVADSAGLDRLATASRIHLIGLGGSGMSALAALLAGLGKQVSGSDLSAEAVARLRQVGLAAQLGHRAEQVGEADLVVISAAIGTDNVELQAARRRGLPVLTHAEALGELMVSRVGVAVAGTHGKTTTTALLGYLLERTGFDPTVLVGGTALNFGSGARVGQGRHLVVEADEYSRRFLSLAPELTLITSIEPDHLDYFRDLEEIVSVFQEFARQLRPGGLLLTCTDDPVLAATPLRGDRRTYGTATAAQWRLVGYSSRAGAGSQLAIETPLGAVTARSALGGRHNALNAVGALAAACLLGAPLQEAAAALADFAGTERRFQTVWRRDGIWIVDDYAHHPAAVRATLAAAREVHTGRLWAVFQPHTTNRLAALFDDFASCFGAADRLTLLPVYQPSGREHDSRQIDSATLAAAVHDVRVDLSPSLTSAEELLAAELEADDLLLVMGAGDVNLLSRRLVERLARPQVCR
jgi:UDP-N-acetylmuramate--alanine ligase